MKQDKFSVNKTNAIYIDFFLSSLPPLFLGFEFSFPTHWSGLNIRSGLIERSGFISEKMTVVVAVQVAGGMKPLKDIILVSRLKVV